ncbi:MAG: hypothetical protein ACTSRK_11105 [Promethearchaeota archaeon]
MKLLLDSSYLFPIVDVDIVEGWMKTDLLKLITSRTFDLFYCDLSLFEIYTKTLKLITNQTINVQIDSLQRGMQSLINSGDLIKIHWWEYIFETEILQEMKSVHNDSIDCEIFYLAVSLCDLFATFDETLIERMKNSDLISAWIKKINPQFSYWIGPIKANPTPFFIPDSTMDASNNK